MKFALRRLLPVLAMAGLFFTLQLPVAAAPPYQESSDAGTTEQREASYYTVQSGDTLGSIAQEFNVPVATLVEVNGLTDAGLIHIGQVLMIPGSDGSLPQGQGGSSGSGEAPDAPRPSPWQRMTRAARLAPQNSPFHKTTWVSYYGRPGVDVMGILGEYSIEELIPRLQEQADAYDEANGPELGVMPAFHLVYGMAAKAPGEDGDHLVFMTDEAVMSYINAAQEAGIGVILDIQIGNLSPAQALEYGLPYLQYPNVHLALDPEFAMSHPDQERPGLPIGFVTDEQINEAQGVMRDYMRENDIEGRKILIVHQFLDTMIRDKADLKRYYRIDLTILADGWGGPWPKISKYNVFMDETVRFTGLKMFYRWDDPLLTEPQVLGTEAVPSLPYVEITPNFVIYQ